MSRESRSILRFSVYRGSGTLRITRAAFLPDALLTALMIAVSAADELTRCISSVSPTFFRTKLRPALGNPQARITTRLSLEPGARPRPTN